LAESRVMRFSPVLQREMQRQWHPICGCRFQGFRPVRNTDLSRTSAAGAS